MLRKFLLALLFVLLPTLSWGACGWKAPCCYKKPCCCWCKPYCWGDWASGPYLGASIGLDTVDYKYSAYVKSFLVAPTLGPLLVTNVIQRNEIAAQGLLGSGFLGYGTHCGLFYLGGELNGNLSTAQETDENFEMVHNSLTKTTRKIDQAWGLSATPGILIPCCTTIVYGRIGYMRGHYKVDSNDTSLPPNVETWLNGIRYGGGIEKRVWRKFSIRLDYSHIVYENRDQTILTPDSTPVSLTTKRTVVSPKQNLFELGFIYRFC